MKKNTILTIIAMMLVSAISVFGTLFVRTAMEDANNYRYIKLDYEVSPSILYKFNEVRQMLQNEYIEEVDDDTLLEGAIAGMAMSLKDPYTMYVPKDIMQLMLERSEGSYSGIGVTIAIPKEGLGAMILYVNEESPAKKAGILPGDRIMEVDGVDVSTSDDLEYIASLVKGKEGTQVNLKVLRELDNTTPSFSIVRATINTVNVSGRMEKDQVGYIRIDSFSQDSDAEFAEAFNQLIPLGMRSLIIDVRDNPGGSLSAILNIADMLMDNGLITYTIDREGNKNEYRARKNGVNIPMVVLINENSASASEMLAGALKDNGLATVIGQTSYGKGLVQGVYTLRDGSGLRVTISKYFTPSGVCIQDIGIEPHQVVEPLEKYKGLPVALMSREDDIQLDTAINVLEEKLKAGR